MADTNKEIAAILREMRGNEFDDPHLDADGIIGARRLARDWADRIERAVKRMESGFGMALAIVKGLRKRDVERSPGNAAAMREALEGIIENLSTRIELGRGNRVTIPVGEAKCIVGYARAALAAPARNCDRAFRSADEAVGAYVTERRDGPHLGYCDAIKWALAPTEEGGAS